MKTTSATAIALVLGLAAAAAHATALQMLWPSSSGDPVTGGWVLSPNASWIVEDGAPVLKVTRTTTTNAVIDAWFGINGTALRGRDFRLVGEVRLDGVSSTVSGFGAKLILAYKSYGEMKYHEPAGIVRTGTTGWITVTRVVRGIPDDVTQIPLALGIQGGTGTVRFRNLRLEEAASYEPELPQGFQCEYTDACRAIPRLRGVMSPAVGNLAADDIRDLSAWGANVMRWQFAGPGADFMPGSDSLTRYQCWFTNRLDHLTSLLPVFKACNIKVVIDCHAPPGGRCGSGYAPPDGSTWVAGEIDAAFRLFFDESLRERFIDNWREVARRFKNDGTVVAYDLYNEPDERLSITNDYIWVQERAARAIREIDSEKPVIVTVNEYASCTAFNDLSPIPVTNVFYTFHMYDPGSYTHQGVGTDFSQQRAGNLISYPANGWDADHLRSFMGPARRFQERWGARIYVGEFSVIRFAPGGAQYLDDVISIFEEYGWDWSYHAFREWINWSVEHANDIDDEQPTTEPTDRLLVLLKYFRNNDDALRLWDVTASQNLTNRTLTVNYTLTGWSGIVRCDILTNGVSIGHSHLKTFSGDYSTDSSKTVAAGARTFSWQPLNDWPNHLVGDLQVKVYAYENTAADLDALAKTEHAFEYMDINLNTGAIFYRDDVALGSGVTQNFTSHLILKRIPAGSVMNVAGNYTIVQTKPFYMCVYEVTNAQWEKLMGASAGSTSVTGPWQHVTKIAYWQIDAYWTLYPGYCATAGDTFIGKLQAKTGVTKFALPSELQWEYAARAGVTGEFPFGATTLEGAVAAGMYNGNALVHAGSPNAFGLYCMPGGAAEFCADRCESPAMTAAAEFGGKTMTDYCGSYHQTWDSATAMASYVIVRDSSIWMGDHKLGTRLLKSDNRLSTADNHLGFRLVWHPNIAR